MSIGEAVALMNGAILQILVLSAPLLIIGVVVGLVISIFQATTSIQDQTISFVPKIVAIMAALIIFGPWMFSTLKQYTVVLMQMIPDMAK